jgi:aldose 1-epimerase
MSFIEQQQWDGATVYKLQNQFFTLSLIPELGSNVYRLWDNVARRDVLRTPATLEEMRAKPVHYGIPLLLPPSRIRNGTFTFNGMTYQMEINTPEGHHIHGFVVNRPWQVIATETGEDSAAITTQLRTADFPELAAQYPHDLTITLRTEINRSSLIQSLSFRNDSDRPAPFGFGVHTWFLVDGEPEKWTLKLPITDIWELDAKIMATGNRLPLGDFDKLNEGVILKGQNMDKAFRIGDKPVEAELSKPGYSIRYRASEPVTHWVVYTKGETHDTVCVEPLTWTPDAPNIQASPELTGMRSIAAGEELKLTLVLDIDRT